MNKHQIPVKPKKAAVLFIHALQDVKALADDLVAAGGLTKGEVNSILSELGPRLWGDAWNSGSEPLVKETAPKPFCPKPGQIYETCGGDEVLCLGGVRLEVQNDRPSYRAFMINPKTGLAATMHGLHRFEDGCIGWYSSTGWHQVWKVHL